VLQGPHAVGEGSEAAYVTSLHEVFWGLVMIAVIMSIHAVGIIFTLRSGRILQRRARGDTRIFHGIGALVASTLLLVTVHLLEVTIWGAFLFAKGAFSDVSTAIYYALMQYTTVSSSLRLPNSLRLLGGIIPLSGMLTVAWSTSALFMLAQPFHDNFARDEGPREHKP
jgi:hypothetical protein